MRLLKRDEEDNVTVELTFEELDLIRACVDDAEEHLTKDEKFVRLGTMPEMLSDLKRRIWDVWIGQG